MSTRVGLFDVYRGAGLTDGKKSLAILVLMQDTARTLTDADIDGDGGARWRAIGATQRRASDATLRQIT